MGGSCCTATNAVSPRAESVEPATDEAAFERSHSCERTYSTAEMVTPGETEAESCPSSLDGVTDDKLADAEYVSIASGTRQRSKSELPRYRSCKLRLEPLYPTDSPQAPSLQLNALTRTKTLQRTQLADSLLSPDQPPLPQKPKDAHRPRSACTLAEHASRPSSFDRTTSGSTFSRSNSGSSMKSSGGDASGMQQCQKTNKATLSIQCQKTNKATPAPQVRPLSRLSFENSPLDASMHGNGCRGNGDDAEEEEEVFNPFVRAGSFAAQTGPWEDTAADKAAAVNEKRDPKPKIVCIINRKKDSERVARAHVVPPVNYVNKHPRHGERQVIDWSKMQVDKWEFIETAYNGQITFKAAPKTDQNTQGMTIVDGIKKMKSDPLTFSAISYQSEMLDWTQDKQSYTLYYRSPESKVMPKEASKEAAYTFLRANYQPLKSNVTIIPDKYTNGVLRNRLGCIEVSEPVSPGRGMGVADVPEPTLMTNVDPKDIIQGAVGDCWLLSAISALAEYDGAIAKLFRNSVAQLPSDDWNMYTITLHDLTQRTKTGFKEVDVIVDERLCCKADGELLGAKPSPAGELWLPYIEKAVAALCGGWDKITGGECTHAWKMLTGCQECYTFRNDDETGFRVYGALNPNTAKWEDLGNSPRDGFHGQWPMAWKDVVEGSDTRETHLDSNDMFLQLCVWEDSEFLMAAGTHAAETTHNGFVDGRAYTILNCANNVAGTGNDLIRVRNPWGTDELKSDLWQDDGPGWEQFPQVKAVLNPQQNEDGIFWMEKDEFFDHFKAIHLCAYDMSEYGKKHKADPVRQAQDFQCLLPTNLTSHITEDIPDESSIGGMSMSTEQIEAAEKQPMTQEEAGFPEIDRIHVDKAAQDKTPIHPSAVEVGKVNMPDWRKAESLGLFTRLDLDKNQVLSLEELAAELSDFGMTEQAIEQLFGTLDTNSDGVIDMDEFVRGYSVYEEACAEMEEASLEHPWKMYEYSTWHGEPQPQTPSLESLTPQPSPGVSKKQLQIIPQRSMEPLPSSLGEKPVSMTTEVPLADLKLTIASATLTNIDLERPSDKPNQDRLMIETSMQDDPNLHLFGVFDGHGKHGHDCAQFAKDNLLDAIYGSTDFKSYYASHRAQVRARQRPDRAKADYSVQKAYDTALKKVNNDMHLEPSVNDVLSGTTAITVMVRGNQLCIANVGDSRAILMQGADPDAPWTAEDLSQDHTPFRPDERERVKSCGSEITTIDEMEGICGRLEPYQWTSDDPPRCYVPACGYPGTAFTRSLGDSLAETIGVVAAPEVLIHDMTPTDQAFLVCSDGITEFLTSQEIADLVREHRDDLPTGAMAVAKEAQKRWLKEQALTDDITIIIVRIGHRNSEEAPASPTSPTSPLLQVTRTYSSLRGDWNGIPLVELLKRTRSGNLTLKRTRSIQRLEEGSEIVSLLSGLSKSGLKKAGSLKAPSDTMSLSLDTNSPLKHKFPVIPKDKETQLLLNTTIRNTPLCHQMADTQVQHLVDVMELITVEKNKGVFLHGEQGEWFYIVASGSFGVFDTDDVMIHQHERQASKPAPSFGEMSLLHGALRQATVRALSDNASLWKLHKQSWVDQCKSAALADEAHIAAGFQQLENMDTNHDGVVDLNEFVAAGGTKKAFKGYDDNLDSVLDTNELALRSAAENLEIRSFDGSAEELENETKPKLKELSPNRTPSQLRMLEEATNRNPLLGRLDPAHRSKLFDVMTRHILAAGDVLYKHGDKATCLYIIEKGVLTVTVDQEDVHTYAAGSCFGEQALVSSHKRASTVTAQCNCTMWVLECDAFKTTLKMAMD